MLVSACAVGTQRGSIRLHRYKNSNCGLHSVLVNYGFGSRIVPITDLDAALDDLGFSDRPVLIMKIDVEGYEPAVIAGAKRTLAHTDVVITEYTPSVSRSGGLYPDEMLHQLHGAGFVPHRLVSDGRTVEIALDKLRRVKEQVDLIWIRVKH